MSRKLLFLCTGNYYRSRFAEAHFNAIAARSGLSWRAESRGLAVALLAHNAGPISMEAVEGLQARGIRVDEDPRSPVQVCQEDLAGADLIIALNEREHRPYLEGRYGSWVHKVEYWHRGKTHGHIISLAASFRAPVPLRRHLQRLCGGGWE